MHVSAPEIKIIDESGRMVIERYYKAGSTLELTCLVKQFGGSNEYNRISWQHGDRTLTEGIR